MAVSYWKLKWSGNTLSGNVLANTRQKTAIYWASVDANTDNERTVREYEDCPKKGDAWSSDPFMIVTDVNVRQVGPLSFEVEVIYVGYSVLMGESAVQNMQLKPRKRWSTIHGSVDWVRDEKYKLPIVNINKEPFDPPPQKDRSDMQLEWTGYFTSFDPAITAQYLDTINQNTLTSIGTWQPGTVRMTGISAEEQAVEGTDLWVVTVTLQMRLDVHPKGGLVGWDEIIVNKGFKVIDDDGKLVNAKDESGQDVHMPVYLDSAGKEIAPDDNGLVDMSKIYYLNFQKYPKKDWSPLGIT